MNNPYYDEFINYYGQERDHDFLKLVKDLNHYTLRDEWVKKYAWAIPNEEAIKKLKDYKIVEIGAGLGYWGYLMRQKGIDCLLFDQEVNTKDLWTMVEKGGPEEVRNDYALMLCWPPYADPMAFDCLKNYKGNTLIYVGEGYGGCTGDDDFHELISKKWEEKEWIQIPQYWGIHDALWIYER